LFFASQSAPSEEYEISGFINQAGKLAFPARYYEANDFSEGLASVKTSKGPNAQWHFIDKTGTIRLSCSPKIRIALNFSEGLAGAQAATKLLQAAQKWEVQR
jgi:hypothetical protein